MEKQAPWWRQIHRHDFLLLILLALTGLAVFGILTLPVSFRGPNLPVKVGQVSLQDYTALSAGEYISDVRTAEARDAAVRAVAPVYTQPDAAISRRQITRLRAALDIIDTVRADNTISLTQKREALSKISDLSLQADTTDHIIFISDSRWSASEQDAMRVLDAIMRASVREDNITVVQAAVPSLVSFVLTEEQANIVVELVTPFIVPNTFFSQELTDAAKQKARQSVEPVTQSYVAGEVVVRRGKVLNDVDVEALEELGLIRPIDPVLEYFGALAIVAVSMTFTGFYFHRRRPTYYSDGRSMVIIALLFVVFLLTARFIIPNRAVLPYIFPIPAFGLLIATLFGAGGALMLSILLSILTAFGLPNGLDLTIYFLMASLLGVLSLGKAHRISSFVWAAVVSSAAGMTVITAYRIPSGSLDGAGYLTLLGASFINGTASASVALMLQYLLADFLGLTTPLRLLEISRPDSPLLQYFLRSAPGTYQHSLMVSNLAEQAAEKLGLDTLLVRVGALYHDVGKSTNASFFIENQLSENLNPHHDLLPEQAAAQVIRHVTDGVELAKRYRLPRRLIDFMLEHHGTFYTRYYYNLAVQAAGNDPSKVDVSKFRYPGPRPRSRETALLMLADNVEARTRSERPRNDEQIRAIVLKAIETCQKEEQLADTRFTFKDLTIITQSFVTTLAGLYHPRIQYPGDPAASSTQPQDKPQ